MHKSVKWGLSTQVFEKPHFPKLIDALEKSGIEYFNSQFDTAARKYQAVPFDCEKDCVVLYGSIQFIRSINKPFLPGAYGFNENVNTRNYMSHIDKDLFFNHDAIYLPFGQITSSKDLLRILFGEKIFIRPDSGYKSFTGFSTTLEELDFEIDSRRQTNAVFPEEFCLIAKHKPILGEYRLVICEKQVITGSQYRWDDKLDIRIDINNECWKFGEKVAKLNWQPDSCFILDVFLSETGPKIGELNSFSCSGLYNCDLEKVVLAVSKAAIKEWA